MFKRLLCAARGHGPTTYHRTPSGCHEKCADCGRVKLRDDLQFAISEADRDRFRPAQLPKERTLEQDEGER
jgi:hypothetical protein